MSAVITDAGRALHAAKLAAEEALTIDEVRYGNPVVTAIVDFDAAAVVDAGGGMVDLPATAHGVPEGSDALVYGTANYNARFVTQPGGGVNALRVVHAYVAENLTLAAKANALFRPDPATTVQGNVVHTGAAPTGGVINDDQVIYAAVLDTTIGDFDITQVGYWHIEGVVETLVMLSNVPTYAKRAADVGVQGNFFRNSCILKITRAAEVSGVTVPPETWAYDFSDRLRGGDERHRLALRHLIGRFAALNGAQIVSAIAPVQKDACDATAGWLASSGVLSVDAADKQEGAGSLKLTGQALNATLTKTLGAAQDWSPYNGVLFGVYSNVGATNVTWFIEDSLGNRSRWDIVAQAAWGEMEIDLTTPTGNNGADADLADVKKFGLEGLDNGVDYHLDDIRVARFNDFGVAAGVSMLEGMEWDGAATTYAAHRAAWATPGVPAALAPPGGGTRTDTVYVDGWFDGDFNTKRVFAQLYVAVAPQADYVDANGLQHYREPLCTILRTTKLRIATAMITDVRRVLPYSNTGAVKDTIDQVVAAAIAALVDSSPATLDTLNELAAALADDPNFAATTAAAIAGKQATAEKNQASGYAGLDAGTKVAAAQIPDLDAAKITTGAFATARIPNLDASKITTGGLPLARIEGFDDGSKWPRFHARLNAAQSIPDSAWTKVNFDFEAFDVGGMFNAGTSKVQPTIPCTLHISCGLTIIGNGTDQQSAQIAIYKNGAVYLYGGTAYRHSTFPSGENSPMATMSAEVDCNGTTDFVEVYFWQNNTGAAARNSGSGALSYFSGHRCG
jgi:hypothetical protein